MKKPINLGQILALGSFFSIAVLLLGINLMKNTLSRGYSIGSEKRKTLNLAYKTAKKALDIQPFNSITLSVPYIDSLIFIPAAIPRVEISGDKVLVDQLRLYRGNTPKHLILGTRIYFHVEHADEDSLYSNDYSLDKGGLIVKVYYQELNNISSHEHVKSIVHKGVFKTDKLSINATANTAQFNVEAKFLHLHLGKPSISNTEYFITNDSINQPLRVVGKADLVEIVHNGGSIVNLTQLHCRHVHADYANADFSFLEVAPTQLFSYIIPKEDEKHHSEMICKSKARVTKARHIPELNLTERFH